MFGYLAAEMEGQSLDRIIPRRCGSGIMRVFAG